MAVVGLGKGVGDALQSLNAAESIVVSLDVLVPASGIAAGTTRV